MRRKNLKPFWNKMAAPSLDIEEVSDLLMDHALNASGDIVLISEMKWRESSLHCALSSVAKKTHSLYSFSSRHIRFGRKPTAQHPQVSYIG